VYVLLEYFNRALHINVLALQIWTRVRITDGLLNCTQIMRTSPVKLQPKQWKIEGNFSHLKVFFYLCYISRDVFRGVSKDSETPKILACNRNNQLLAIQITYLWFINLWSNRPSCVCLHTCRMNGYRETFGNLYFCKRRVGLKILIRSKCSNRAVTWRSNYFNGTSKSSLGDPLWKTLDMPPHNSISALHFWPY